MPVPPSLDVYALARDRGSVQGRFALADLKRLATSLVDTSGGLDYAIRGMVDERGRPGATMHLAAQLTLQCQRCNGPLAYALAREASFRFVGSEEELNALPVEDDDTDLIVGSRTMDVQAWVEDEAILSLPLVPRHAHCPVPVAAVSDGAQAEARPNPFAALARLKRGG